MKAPRFLEIQCVRRSVHPALEIFYGLGHHRSTRDYGFGPHCANLSPLQREFRFPESGRSFRLALRRDERKSCRSAVDPSRSFSAQFSHPTSGHSATAPPRLHLIGGWPTRITSVQVSRVTKTLKDGTPVGKAVEVLIECGSGCVNYVVVATNRAGGIAEELRAVPRKNIKFGCERLTLKMDNDAFWAFAILEPGAWPETA